MLSPKGVIGLLLALPACPSRGETRIYVTARDSGTPWNLTTVTRPKAQCVPHPFCRGLAADKQTLLQRGCELSEVLTSVGFPHGKLDSSSEASF